MNVIQDVLRARKRRLAMRDLRSLSSHQLRDIGIEPGGIEAAVSKMLADRAATPQESGAARTDARSPKPAVVASSPRPYSQRRAA